MTKIRRPKGSTKNKPTTHTISIRVEKNLYNKIQKLADQDERSVSSYVNRILRHNVA